MSDIYITLIRTVSDNLDKYLKHFLLLPYTVDTRVAYGLENVYQLGSYRH